MIIVIDCENPECEKWYEGDAEVFNADDEGCGMLSDCTCPYCGWEPSSDLILAKLKPAEPEPDPADLDDVLFWEGLE